MDSLHGHYRSRQDQNGVTNYFRAKGGIHTSLLRHVLKLTALRIQDLYPIPKIDKVIYSLRDDTILST